MRKIIIVFTLVLQAFGFEHQYIHKSYEDAQSDTDNYIRVAGESTKLGFITTEYDGFVKKYKISYLKKNEKIEALYIKISACTAIQPCTRAALSAGFRAKTCEPLLRI